MNVGGKVHRLGGAINAKTDFNGIEQAVVRHRQQ